MKGFLLICALLLGVNSSAQVRMGLQNPIQYIGASSINGNSDAVIVENVPLVHTKQFLPLGNNGKIIGQANLNKQLDQVFKNIDQVLKESGSDTDQIIKLNVFLKNSEDISKVKSLIGMNFHDSRKPSITFAIGELSHPDALISIDAIATSSIKSDKVEFTVRESQSQAPAAILPAGPVVYVSGQAAKGDLATATKGTLTQLKETLISLGLTTKDVVQIKSFLTPMASLEIVEKEFAEFFKGETIPPLVFVDWISADPVIEIELIASSPVPTVKVPQVEYITPPGMLASPVYSKVSRLNYGKKVYLSGISGIRSDNTDSEVNGIFQSMGKVLKTTGSDFNHLLKATYYISKDQYSKSLGDIRPKYYDPKLPPAASKAMIKSVGLNGAGISVDMIATIKE